MFTFLFVSLNPNNKNSKTGEQMGGGCWLAAIFQDSSSLHKQKLSKVFGIFVPTAKVPLSTIQTDQSAV